MPSRTPPRISVLLPTYNNASIVRGALESVRWADEILVVDSYSTDQTVDICREYGARVLQHEYLNSAKQKNWAIPQCANEWILQIDTDERLEPGLREEILTTLADAAPDVDGYQMPFKHVVLGEWMKTAGLYPEMHLRLFRRDRGRFEAKEVHAHVRVPGHVGVLQHHMMHFGMGSISKQLRNIDRYSRYQADELRQHGRHFHWHQLVLRPLAIFVLQYIVRRGFASGFRGLLIAALNASFDFWSHAKLWELERLQLEASPK